MPFGESILVAIFCMLVVFVVLVSLSFILSLTSRLFQYIERTSSRKSNN